MVYRGRIDDRFADPGKLRPRIDSHDLLAALEAVAYQTRDLLAAMEADGAGPVASLRVDGGMGAEIEMDGADVLAAHIERNASYLE